MVPRSDEEKPDRRQRRRRARLKTLAVLTFAAIGFYALSTSGPTWRVRLRLPEAGGLLAFSPDGKILAQAGPGGFPGRNPVIRLWDAARGTLQRRLEIPTDMESSISSIAFSPDGSMLVAGCANHAPGPNRARVWEVATGKELATLEIEPLYMTHVVARFSPDGQALLVLKTLGGAEPLMWETRRWRPLPIPGDDEPREEDWVGAVFSADGRTLARATRDGVIRLWDLASGRRRDLREGRDLLNESLFLSPDGKFLAVTKTGNPFSGQIGGLCLWDVGSGMRRTIPARKVGTFGFGPEIAPDGHTLVRSGADGRTRGTAFGNHIAEFWDMGTATLRFSLDTRPELDEYFGAMAFTPDGRLVALSSSHLSPAWLFRIPLPARLWLLGHFDLDAGDRFDVDLRDIRTGRSTATLGSLKGPVEDLVFSPDSKTLATVDTEGKVILWDEVH